MIERHLGVGEQYRQFRACQAVARCGAGGERFVVGQKFERTVEPSGAFQVADQPGLAVEGSGAARLGDRQCLALQIIVAQHQGGNIVGHLRQQRVAFLPAQRSGRDRAAEQDLDIDFVVRHRDAGRIVDRVGVDAAALQRIGDAARCVTPRLAPSQTTLARTPRRRRGPSLARSPTSAWLSACALTKVPMPPKNNRSMSAVSRWRTVRRGSGGPRQWRTAAFIAA